MELKAYISDTPEFPDVWPDPMAADLVGAVSTTSSYTVAGVGKRNILYIDVGTELS